MTSELDVPTLDADGPAAPPRANGELVFEHPWQSRVFATTMALCDAGAITYDAFRDRLIAEIGRRSGTDEVDAYWASWQDALEGLLAELGLCDDELLTRRAREFSEH